MSDNSFYIIIDFFVAACGVYVVVQYLLMIKTGKIRQNALLPKDISADHCRDAEGYIKAIGIKQLVFGLAATICGTISLVQDLMGVYNMYLSLASMVVFLVLCVWYGRASKKAIEQFW